MANLSPAEQAILAPPPLNTRVARKKAGKGKKKSGGLGPVLEHNDLGNDGYYIKPDLPTKDPHGGKSVNK